MNKEELFVAVLSGDFSQLDIGYEELLAVLMKNGYISTTQEFTGFASNHQPASETEMSFKVLIEFNTEQQKYEMGSFFYANLPGGWNNETFRAMYDNTMDMYDLDDYEERVDYAYEQSELGKAEGKYMKKKWRLE